jgi:hypothetical protein
MLSLDEEMDDDKVSVEAATSHLSKSLTSAEEARNLAAGSVNDFLVDFARWAFGSGGLPSFRTLTEIYLTGIWFMKTWICLRRALSSRSWVGFLRWP